MLKGISVKPDSTKMQIETRLQKRKRKLEDEQSVQDSAKKSKPGISDPSGAGEGAAAGGSGSTSRP